MKHLIITGSSGGLGIELLKHFLDKDFDFLYAVGNQKKFLEFDIKSPKLKYIFDLNLTEENDLEKLFSYINLSSEDELFIIHCIGGYTGGKKFYEYDKNELLEMFNKNFVTAYLVSKQAVNKIKNSKGGSIVFFSSSIALEYISGRSVYTISKYALHHLIKIIEKEAKEFNFTANIIAPTIILTEENRKWVNPSDSQNYVEPVEIAEMIENIFLNYQKINGNIFTITS